MQLASRDHREPQPSARCILQSAPLNTLDTLGLVLIQARVLPPLEPHAREQAQERAAGSRRTTRPSAGNGSAASSRCRINHRSSATSSAGILTLSKQPASSAALRVEKNKAEDGLQCDVLPGPGFFEDYQHYYLDARSRGCAHSARCRRAAGGEGPRACRLLPSAARPPERTRFEDHETAYADELLATHSEADIRDLIDYAVAEAAKTKFDTLFFGALKRYVDAVERRRRPPEGAGAPGRQSCSACPHCTRPAFLELREDRQRPAFRAPVPASLEQITKIEDGAQGSTASSGAGARIRISGCSDPRKWGL